jgi:hypothetical protein
MKTFLRIWLISVAFLRVLSVILGYFYPATLGESVFGRALSQVTPLTARTFGTWTLLSSVVTLMCALNIESGPLYRTTMASFVIAIVYFFLEVEIYRTVDVRSAMTPFIIASKSKSCASSIFAFPICVQESAYSSFTSGLITTATSTLVMAIAYSSIVVEDTKKSK